MEWKISFHFQFNEMENGMEWNGMESGKENFYLCLVERKKSGMEMEWKVEWKIFINATGNGKWNGMEWNGKWNGKFSLVFCGMEKHWNGKWNGNGME